MGGPCLQAHVLEQRLIPMLQGARPLGEAISHPQARGEERVIKDKSKITSAISSFYIHLAYIV